MTISVSRPLRPVATNPPELADLVPIDIEETDDAYVVDLDLPNVGEDDVRIELRGNELRISGEFRDRRRTGILRRQSRRAGEFEYLVALPGDIDAERVDASLEHGVLRVWTPKAERAPARRIQVHKPPDPASAAGSGPAAQPGAAQRSR